ncbi:hypothetical protein WR25_23835 isoform B [Diploscapter pachys]|nr:hypothetical protein WR25_23835 isoform B [Diploscapter pachys]
MKSSESSRFGNDGLPVSALLDQSDESIKTEEEPIPDNGKPSCSKSITSSLKNSGPNLKRPIEKTAYNGRTKIGLALAERRRRPNEPGFICILCDKFVFLSNVTLHAAVHLSKDKYFTRYGCIFPDCSYTNRGSINMEDHIQVSHMVGMDYKCHAGMEKETEIRARISNQVILCFGDISAASDSAQGTSQGELQVVKCDIPVHKPKPKNDPNILPAKKKKNSPEPTNVKKTVIMGSLHCRICSKFVETPITSDAVIEHAFIHGHEKFGMTHYYCRRCRGYSTAYLSEITLHDEKEHHGVQCFENFSKNWSDSMIRKLSTQCYGNPNLLPQLLQRDPVNVDEEIMRNAEMELKSTSSLYMVAKRPEPKVINYANLKSMNDIYLNAKTGDVTKKYINFFCGLCMRRFSGIPSSIGVFDHMMLHMKNEYEMREYKCYLCDFTHEKRNEIIKHTQDVHSKMVFINDESLKDYNIENIKAISKKIFGSPDTAFRFLPTISQKKFAGHIKTIPGFRREQPEAWLDDVKTEVRELGESSKQLNGDNNKTKKEPGQKGSDQFLNSAGNSYPELFNRRNDKVKDEPGVEVEADSLSSPGCSNSELFIHQNDKVKEEPGLEKSPKKRKLELNDIMTEKVKVEVVIKNEPR